MRHSKRIMALCLSSVLLSGCWWDSNPNQQQDSGRKNMEENKPFMIAEVDGVRLYKVRDDTSGGAQYVYFTTRGSTTWIRGCGKSCTQWEHVEGAWD
jgi:hypothetical protein